MVKKKTTKKKTKTKTVSRIIVDKKRDALTKKKIEDFGSDVVDSSLSQREPSFEIPTRSVTNMKFNKKKRILEMGSNTQRRSLFNLGQSKKFMQSLLLAKGCRDLIDAQKTLRWQEVIVGLVDMRWSSMPEPPFRLQACSFSSLCHPDNPFAVGAGNCKQDGT